MDQILEKLLESVPKARILRLFMQNPLDLFSSEEVAKKTQLKRSRARKELEKLLNLKIIFTRINTIKNKENKKDRGKKIKLFGANPHFGLAKELQELVRRSAVASKTKLLRQIKGLGKVKLAIISGIFINYENARTDLLLVGEGISKRKLDNFLSHLESDLGRSVQYTLMDTDEFKYRMGMYDRFLRDIVEYPHQKLINKFDL